MPSKRIAVFDIQLGKCKLYVKDMSLEEARALVRSIFNDEPGLSSISDMLHVHDDQSKQFIQVDGIMCIVVPIGSPAFVSLPSSRLLLRTKHPPRSCEDIARALRSDHQYQAHQILPQY